MAIFFFQQFQGGFVVSVDGRLGAPETAHFVYGFRQARRNGKHFENGFVNAFSAFVAVRLASRAQLQFCQFVFAFLLSHFHCEFFADFDSFMRWLDEEMFPRFAIRRPERKVFAVHPPVFQRMKLECANRFSSWQMPNQVVRRTGAKQSFQSGHASLNLENLAGFPIPQFASGKFIGGNRQIGILHSQ